MRPVSEQVPISRLRDDLRGEVIAPGDAGYDEARTVFPGTIDRRPAVVVRPVDAREVAVVARSHATRTASSPSAAAATAGRASASPKEGSSSTSRP